MYGETVLRKIIYFWRKNNLLIFLNGLVFGAVATLNVFSYHWHLMNLDLSGQVRQVRIEDPFRKTRLGVLFRPKIELHLYRLFFCLYY
jgi:hypothetical protein